MKKSILIAGLLVSTPLIVSTYAQSSFAETQSIELQVFSSDSFIFKAINYEEIDGKKVYVAMSIGNLENSNASKLLHLELKVLGTDVVVMDLGYFTGSELNENGITVFRTRGTLASPDLKLDTKGDIINASFKSGLGDNRWQKEDLKIFELKFYKD